MDFEEYKKIYINNTETIYSISTKGSVRNDNTGRVLKPGYTQDGYQLVGLSINGKKNTQRVHRLVAESFIPNPENKLTVNHIDGDKSNNSIENLEWCTYSENIKHAYDNNLHTRECPTRKVTNKQINIIEEYIDNGYTNKEISNLTNVPHYTISAIRNRCIKVATSGKIINKEFRRSKHEYLIHEICKLLDKGYSNNKIFKELSPIYPSINKSLIGHVKSGDRYIYIIKDYNFYKNRELGSTTIENT